MGSYSILFCPLKIKTTTVNNMSGTLEIIIRRADGLYDVGGWADTIDPFVKCIPTWLEKSKKKNWKATNYVDNGGVNVIFDEIKNAALLKFDIPEKREKGDKVYIEVRDYDSFSGSDFIGSAEVDISKLLLSNKKENEATVALTRTKSKKEIPAGTVVINFKHVLPPPPASKRKSAPTKKKKKKGKNGKDIGNDASTPRTENKETQEVLKIVRDITEERDLKSDFEAVQDEENDEAGDGNVTYSVFEEMLRFVVFEDKEEDEQLTKKQMDLLIKYVDSDGNSTINLEEFQAAMTRKIGPGSSLDQLLTKMAEVFAQNPKESFEHFDGDDSGSMSYDEFSTTLLGLFTELNLSAADIAAVQKHFDPNLDQQIHANEFRAALLSKVVPATETVTVVDEETGEEKELTFTKKEIDEASKSTAERVREQRKMPIDMSLKAGVLEIRVKRGDLLHDTSGMMDSKMDPYVRVRYVSCLFSSCFFRLFFLFTSNYLTNYI